MGEPLDLDAIEARVEAARNGTTQPLFHNAIPDLAALVAECRALAASIQRVRDVAEKTYLDVSDQRRSAGYAQAMEVILFALDSGGESPVPDATP